MAEGSGKEAAGAAAEDGAGALAAQAARWLASVGWEDLPGDVREATRLRILDVIGVVLAANDTEVGRGVRAAAVGLGGGGASSILGSGERVSPAAAALANGTMASALDFDDTHNETVIHFSSPTVVTALALAEAGGQDAGAVMTAVAAASELTCRFGLIAPGQFHKRGFHASAIASAFGATLAAGKLLGLSAEEITHALGIAGSQAAGIAESWNDGTTVRFVHTGWAAQSGIAAALMARGGVTGPARVIEGSRGLYATHIQNPEPPLRFERFLAGLGEAWELRRTSYKPYPCGHVIHSFIDAALHLYHAEGLRADMVERIVCPVADYMLPMVCEPAREKVAPASDTVARVSLQYTIAEALATGALDARSYRPETMADPAVLDLARRVECVVDPDAPGRQQYRGWVKVHTRDGRLLERVEAFNRGSAERPLSVDEIRGKFLLNASLVLDEARAEEVAGRVERLSGDADVAALVRACCR